MTGIGKPKLIGSVANISLNTIYSDSFNNKTTTDSGFKNICDRTFFYSEVVRIR
jgi:hypothetical protein